jgi:hypothetical protein
LPVASYAKVKKEASHERLAGKTGVDGKDGKSLDRLRTCVVAVTTEHQAGIAAVAGQFGRWTGLLDKVARAGAPRPRSFAGSMALSLDGEERRWVFKDGR